MRTFTLKCDRCGSGETLENPHASKLDLKQVGICVRDGNYGGVEVASLKSSQEWSLKNSQEWCAPCRAEIGLAWRSAEAKAEKPDPALEEQLAEVLKSIIHQEVSQ